MADITVRRIEEFDSPNGGGFCRLGRRQVTTGDEGVQLLAIGAVPERASDAPPFTEEGASLPG